jgi:hypothetical protein
VLPPRAVECGFYSRSHQTKDYAIGIVASLLSARLSITNIDLSYVQNIDVKLYINLRENRRMDGQSSVTEKIGQRTKNEDKQNKETQHTPSSY